MIFLVNERIFVRGFVDAVGSDDVTVGIHNVAAAAGLIEAAAPGTEAVLRIIVLFLAFVTGDRRHVQPSFVRIYVFYHKISVFATKNNRFPDGKRLFFTEIAAYGCLLTERP